MTETEREDRRKIIIPLIESQGISNIETNGYWYDFEIDGHKCSVVDQQSRLCYCYDSESHSHIGGVMDGLPVSEIVSRLRNLALLSTPGHEPFYPSESTMDGVNDALRRVNPALFKTAKQCAQISILEACWRASYPDAPAPCSKEVFDEAYRAVFDMGKGMPDPHSRLRGIEWVAAAIGCALVLAIILI